MSQNTPRLDLPLIQAAQAQKHVTHNSAIEILDAITQLNVVMRDAQTPPAQPAQGDSYALGGSPTGDWIGQADTLAVRTNGGWLFIAPRDGWRLWDAQNGVLCVRSGGEWVIAADNLQNADGVGINTTSDLYNRLAVSSPATLLTHEGATGGHQLKLNKAAVGDTASVLFQTGYSGRAEMGTTGADNFAIKVSDDGTTFKTALSFDATTGIVSGDAVQQTADDTTPGRLMRVDFGYSPASILGSVSEVSGTPTGALIERGSTAKGDYVRFADGTQICMADLTLSYADSNRIEFTWVFPVPFSGAPVSVSGSINADSLLSDAAPDLDEICGLLHSGTNASQTKLLQYRVAGTTDFIVGDTANAHCLAVGRWF